MEEAVRLNHIKNFEKWPNFCSHHYHRTSGNDNTVGVVYSATRSNLNCLSTGHLDVIELNFPKLALYCIGNEFFQLYIRWHFFETFARFFNTRARNFRPECFRCRHRARSFFENPLVGVVASIRIVVSSQHTAAAVEFLIFAVRFSLVRGSRSFQP